MRFFAPMCLVFACFTAPHGDLGVWVMKSQVVAVEHAIACDPAARTQIVTTSGTVCVVESPKTVLDILNKLKDDDK